MFTTYILKNSCNIHNSVDIMGKLEMYPNVKGKQLPTSIRYFTTRQEICRTIRNETVFGKGENIKITNNFIRALAIFVHNEGNFI